MLEHGGKLNAIAQQFAIPVEDWLDLSTGISPYSYPIPQIPEWVWRTLPQHDIELLKLACHYYQAENLLPLAGSQNGIQTLPNYRVSLGYSPSRVWLPKQGYKEHEKAWQANGFIICHYDSIVAINELTQFDIVVVINPNNPTGSITSRALLLALHHKINQLDGWLIVDEAFIDGVNTESSVMPYSNSNSLFVFRSVGKYFGLAGIRLGFIASSQFNLSNLNTMLGPWHVNGPAAFIAKSAFADLEWQCQQKIKLQRDSTALQKMLEAKFGGLITGTNLFKTVYLANAEKAYLELCRQGIYVRLTDEKDALRFGIPKQQQLVRLDTALTNLSCTR